MRRLFVLVPRLAVCRLDPSTPLPYWAQGGSFLSVTRTSAELSVVCEDALVPEGTQAERGWRAFGVAGTLDFSLTGVLASLAVPLAEAGISVFAVSTFDTDYLLVREHSLSQALETLERAGFEVSR